MHQLCNAKVQINMQTNKIELTVDGMTCTGCAANVERYLTKKGLTDVYVNFSTKEVVFSKNKSLKIDDIKKGISNLGFVVVEADMQIPFWTIEKKLTLASIFTIPLFLHHMVMMFGLHIPLMDNFWVQFAICLPVFIIGVLHFGRSAWSSLRAGMPNMDVLIFIGSTAAFIYSVIGTVLNEHNYIFYETSAMIITLVLLGNLIEKRAVDQTTSSIKELSKLKVEKANVVMPSGAIISVKTEELMPGNILQVNTGDKVPTDGLILSGNGLLNESLLTGESIPIQKTIGQEVIGASVVEDGNFRMKVTAVGKNTVLTNIIDLVKKAQQEKPDIQRLADKISAIFVPVVLMISVLTLLISYFGFGIPFGEALMRAIAVLVISCPCAMGLATPTAVMVGVGRLAKNGILIKGGQTVETFAGIKNIVFDKTGTLTTGEFEVKKINYFGDENEINAIIHDLEQHSSHPIAKSLIKAFPKNGVATSFQSIEEIKGKGMSAIDTENNVYQLGSNKILDQSSIDPQHDIYLTKNNQLLATIDLQDDLKKETKEVIDYLNKENIDTIILSGDKEAKTKQIAETLKVDYLAEQLPEQKLNKIESLSNNAPTAMVGDGINDAPALARATIGVSLSDASHTAIQTSQVVLMNGNIGKLKKAFQISKHTLLTIKQNLFWAFAYNIIAIPIAALGFLNPMWGAIFMALSDVIVIGNSIRLKSKPVD